LAENQSVKESCAIPSLACPIHDPRTIDFERIECPAGGERFVLGRWLIAIGRMIATRLGAGNIWA
jgi:hypothetical protein